MLVLCVFNANWFSAFFNLNLFSFALVRYTCFHLIPALVCCFLVALRTLKEIQDDFFPYSLCPKEDVAVALTNATKVLVATLPVDQSNATSSGSDIYCALCFICNLIVI